MCFKQALIALLCSIPPTFISLPDFHRLDVILQLSTQTILLAIWYSANSQFTCHIIIGKICPLLLFWLSVLYEEMPRTYRLLLLSLKFIALGKPLIYETICYMAATVDHIQSLAERWYKSTWDVSSMTLPWYRTSGLCFQKITEGNRLAILFAS